MEVSWPASRNFWKPSLSATILLCLSILLPGMRMPPFETMSLKANLMSRRAAGAWIPGPCGSYHICLGPLMYHLCGRGTNFYLVSVTVIMVFLSFKTQHNPNFCLLSIKETWGFGQQLSSLRGKWWIPGSTPYGHRAIEKRGYFYPVFPMCSTWDPWSPWNSKAGFQSV